MATQLNSTQLNSTRRRVELSCVAINGLLGAGYKYSYLLTYFLYVCIRFHVDYASLRSNEQYRTALFNQNKQHCSQKQKFELQSNGIVRGVNFLTDVDIILIKLLITLIRQRVSIKHRKK